VTTFVIIGCVAILAFTILTCVTIFVQAWERVQVKRTDNFVTVNRDSLAAQRILTIQRNAREPLKFTTTETRNLRAALADQEGPTHGRTSAT